MDTKNTIINFPIFKDFSKEEILELLGMEEIRLTFKNGDFILSQGEAGSAIYILIDGQARITKNQGPNIELNTLVPGTIFGESPLITNSTRLTNVVAKGEVTLLKLDGNRIKNLNPAICNKLHVQLNKILVSRLDTMNNNLSEVKAGIDNFIKVYDSHGQKMEQDPSISEEFKMVQRLWSTYLANLRTK